MKPKGCPELICLFRPDRSNRLGEYSVRNRVYQVHYCARCKKYYLVRPVVFRAMKPEEREIFEALQDK